MKTINRNHIVQAIRLLLCCTFLYAAMLKGVDFAQFAFDMKKSPILEPFNTTVLAVFVLFFEIAAAVLLAFQGSARAGLYLSFFIMLLFSGYLFILYTRYPNAPCSCGGILGRLPYPVHITFNIVLTILAAIGIFLCSPRRKNMHATA